MKRRSATVATDGTADAGVGVPTVLTRAALGDAFDVHAQAIYRHCLREVGDRTEAEDLMSIVFLEAWRSRNRAVLVDGTLAPWLFGIAKNVIRTRRRSTRRHTTALAAYRAEFIVPDHSDIVVAKVDAPATRRIVDDALAALGDRERAVAEAVLVDGRTSAEAAAMLGITESAAKSRLGRARTRLRMLVRTGEQAAQTSLPVPTGHVGDRSATGASVAGPRKTSLA